MEFNVNDIKIYGWGTASLFRPKDDKNECILTCAHNLLYYNAEEGELIPAKKITIILGKYKGEYDDYKNDVLILNLNP